MMPHKLSCAQEGFRPLLTAGQFFPRERTDMERLFRETLQKVHDNSNEHAELTTLPRGAYQYTGIDIMKALNAVVPRFNEVSCIILLARVLREPEPCIWLPDYRGFDTPFRRFTVAEESLANLEKLSKVYTRDRIRFEEDPAFDIPLTVAGFLGYFGTVLPVLLGNSGDELIAVLKDTLPKVFKRNRTLLFAVTSDSLEMPPGEYFFMETPE